MDGGLAIIRITVAVAGGLAGRVAFEATVTTDGGTTRCLVAVVDGWTDRALEFFMEIDGCSLPDDGRVLCD